MNQIKRLRTAVVLLAALLLFHPPVPANAAAVAPPPSDFTVNRVSLPVRMVLAEEGADAASVASLLPHTVKAGRAGCFKELSVAWNLEEAYRPDEAFSVTGSFTGYCPGEDRWYNVLLEKDYPEMQPEKLLTISVRYIGRGPVQDLRGISRTFGGVTSVSLRFNEYRLEDITYCCAPPGASSVSVETSEDGVSWARCPDNAVDAGEGGFYVYLTDAAPRWYRVSVTGGAQEGVSNAVILPEPPGDSEDTGKPDDSASTPPDGGAVTPDSGTVTPDNGTAAPDSGDSGSDNVRPDENGGTVSGNGSVSGNGTVGTGGSHPRPGASQGGTSLGGEDSDIGGNRGGGTQLLPSDRKPAAPAVGSAGPSGKSGGPEAMDETGSNPEKGALASAGRSEGSASLPGGDDGRATIACLPASDPGAAGTRPFTGGIPALDSAGAPAQAEAGVQAGTGSAGRPDPEGFPASGALPVPAQLLLGALALAVCLAAGFFVTRRLLCGGLL